MAQEWILDEKRPHTVLNKQLGKWKGGQTCVAVLLTLKVEIMFSSKWCPHNSGLKGSYRKDWSENTKDCSRSSTRWESSFELKLPQSMRVHQIFHASMLNSYHGDSDGSTSTRLSRPSIADTPPLRLEVAKILEHWTVYQLKAKPYYKYLVRWSSQSRDKATWEREAGFVAI